MKGKTKHKNKKIPKPNKQTNKNLKQTKKAQNKTPPTKLQVKATAYKICNNEKQ